MAKTQYLEYTINLTDKEQVATLQAAYPGGILIAPEAAALAYLAPIQLVTEPADNPGTRSPHFILDSPNNYPRDVAEFTRKSGGWFGLSFLFGSTTTFKWVGRFIYASDDTAVLDGAETEEVPIAKRKWQIGFEGLQTPAGPPESDGGGNAVSGFREASRHIDGFGWYSLENGEWLASPTESGDVASNEVWERFYFKMITAPSSVVRMHRTDVAGGANRGARLYMTVGRQIAAYNSNDVGVETLMGTTTQVFELDTWYRVDLLTKIESPGGRMRVYINRALKLTAVAPDGSGIATNSTHSGSRLGASASHGAANTFQCYYDDWIGSAWPSADSRGRFVGLDWLNGSRVRHIPATAFASGNAWAGLAHYANQWPQAAAGVDTASVLQTVVPNDALRLLMDTIAITAVPGAIGVVAFEVSVYGRNQVAGAGMLGWRFNGVTDLATQTGEGGNTTLWYRRYHQPSGQIDPIQSLTPIELHKTKANDANQAEYWAAGLTVELIGVFGEEDVGEDETDQPEALPPRKGLHNAPYPTTMWARPTLAPISPVIIHTGTYVGNGTLKELFFRCPVGWLMIRRTASERWGSFWWSSMVGGHHGSLDGVDVGMPQAGIDPTFVSTGAEDDQEQRTVIRLIGGDNGWNVNAETYEFVAFMDPGARYHLNGAYQITSTAFATKTVPLVNPDFVPEWGFYFREAPGTSGGSGGHFVKGIGHGPNVASPIGGAEDATCVTHAAGLLTIRATLMGATGNRTHAFSVWRDDDQSADPNRHSVLKIGSYVGDGTAARVIVFGESGRRPVYAIVTPHDAQSVHRDPFNLTDTSNRMSAGDQITTGLTAGGIDSFTVGITLNALGVTYDYFVLIGSATAGNGGWSIDGEFTLVEPDSPSDGDWSNPDDAIPQAPGDVDPDPGPSDSDDCATGGAVCIAATTREVNRALLEIGSTKFLENYCTQQTLEAQTARLLYESSVRSVLHAFPWPFATKYATLVQAGTQPTHEDWDYQYRQPTDCVFERRLVVDRGNGVDPKGPPFELASDATGGLILTNEPNAVLEYTCRPACVAFAGDALFKEALVWHLAAKLAPPLTRMPDKAKFCMEQYELSIAKAHAIIKPGQPGDRGVDPLQDTGASNIAANVAVANLALVRIGANTIANLATEQSREAVAVNLVFEHELRSTLRDYPWKFAKRYNTALALVGGTSSVPVNPDWQYSYRLPADYVSVRRLVTEGTGRSFEREPITYEVGSDDTGYLLFTGSDAPKLEYTARVNGAVAKSDQLFRDALAWRIAASLAVSLAQKDPETEEARGRGPEHPPDPTQRVSHKPNQAAMRERAQRWAFGMYLRALEKARVADANESEPEPHGDAEWIEGRN